MLIYAAAGSENAFEIRAFLGYILLISNLSV